MKPIDTVFIVLESFELRVVSEEGFEFYTKGFSPLAFVGAEAIVLKCDETNVVMKHDECPYGRVETM
jgi:aspartate/glutamate racemase